MKRLTTRKTNRLKGYDYSCRGGYFVTICVENRQKIMGKIENNKMVLNDIGHMVDHWWHETFNKFKNISIDEYVIMPDHVHGIINIVGVDLRIDPLKNDNHVISQGENIVSPLQGFNIGRIVSWFKRMTTNQYIKNVKNNNWPKFDKRFWQRNYHDHIIRDDESLDKIREYIINNPLTWNNDENNMYFGFKGG
jgi:REP element-mobilizing transposase RayT